MTPARTYVRASVSWCIKHMHLTKWLLYQSTVRSAASKTGQWANFEGACV